MLFSSLFKQSKKVALTLQFAVQKKTLKHYIDCERMGEGKTNKTLSLDTVSPSLNVEINSKHLRNRYVVEKISVPPIFHSIETS